MKKTLCSAMALLLLTTASFAQDYPTGTVTIVVPYSPSGSTDPMARFLASELQELWGVTVLVDNRPGAGSTIGTAYVANASGDGLTLLLTTPAFTTAPAVYDDLPYDPQAMVPVAMLANSSYVLTVGASVKANTIAELIEETKTRGFFMATSGLGSSTHFAGERFVAATGIETEPVHYKGGTEAMVDLMGGRADIYVAAVAAAIGNIKGGQIRALAVMGDERAAGLPDVPAASELGIDNVSSNFWLGVFAPEGTSDEIATKINNDMLTILRGEEGQTFLATLDSTLPSLTPAEFEQVVDEEIDQWKLLAAERGIAAQ